MADRPCVLVFSGADPSGGAGIAADILAISALGCHALPVITVLTAQDNERVFAVYPVDAAQVRRQAQVVIDKIAIAAVKIGIIGSRANADAIADLIAALGLRQPDLPVILDPVLASGRGDALAREDAVRILQPLLPLASLVTPNLPEATALCKGEGAAAVAEGRQGQHLLAAGWRQVLIKGGHGDGDAVINRWFSRDAEQTWTWPRLPGAFHGSGCTLAAAIAASLAQRMTMADALLAAQTYTQHALAGAYAVADGQRMPDRLHAQAQTS
jgi:hydroxymethylpyrimidine/phosphomethylpyrimidine kinase